MKVIIMAAGVGSRLARFSNGKPKCLIEAGEETLLQRIVRICKSRGLDDITVITGYKADLVKSEIGDQVEYVNNALFSKTNSIYSLWLAKERLSGDIIFMNADLFFEENLLDLVLEQTREITMLSDSTRIKDADYRFSIENDQIVRYGKDLTVEETDAEYVGIAKIASSFTPFFCKRLESLIANDQVNCWWEDVLYSFITENIPVYQFDVAGTFWTEVDDEKDFRRLQNWVNKDSINKTTFARPLGNLPPVIELA